MSNLKELNTAIQHERDYSEQPVSTARGQSLERGLESNSSSVTQVTIIYLKGQLLSETFSILHSIL